MFLPRFPCKESSWPRYSHRVPTALALTLDVFVRSLLIYCTPEIPERERSSCWEQESEAKTRPSFVSPSPIPVLE